MCELHYLVITYPVLNVFNMGVDIELIVEIGVRPIITASLKR